MAALEDLLWRAARTQLVPLAPAGLWVPVMVWPFVSLRDHGGWGERQPPVPSAPQTEPSVTLNSGQSGSGREKEILQGAAVAEEDR